MVKKQVAALLVGMALVSPVWAQGFPFEAEEEDASPQRERVEPSPMQDMLEALAAELPARQLVHLPLSGDSTFLALTLPALSAQPRGQLLLLPADGLHPDWPYGIAPIRRNLPEYGWSTLSLSLPPYQPLGVAPRTLPPGPLLASMQAGGPATGAKSTPQGVTVPAAGGFPESLEEDEAPVDEVRPDPAERLAAHREAVMARVEAGLAHLDGPGARVLVLQGESVFWLQPWLAEGQPAPRTPLVLLQVDVPEGADAIELAETLRQLGSDWPILDIYDARHPGQQRLAEQRRAAYRQAGNRRAVQLPLHFESGTRAATTDRWLAQRVEGWLRGL